MAHRHKRLIGTGVVLAMAAALALIAGGGPPALAQGDIIYVDLDAPGPTHDGSTWEYAYTGLQDALADAEAGDQIWVAAGTYRPTDGTDRTISFQMKNEVAIYGGFDPSIGDVAWEDRDWVNNSTILSGDIAGNDEPGFINNDENSYHVFYHPDGTDLNSSAILDGFTITGGNANGTAPHNDGGGMLNDGSSPALTNCTFSGNSAIYGGGMYNDDSSPVLTNCTFSGNSADDDGGGMHNSNSAPVLANCTFAGNSTQGSADDYGGGMYNQSSSPVLTNCTFVGNSGYLSGALFNGSGSSPTLTNCILWANSANEIYNYDSSSTPVVSYSDIEGGCAAGPNNICGDGNIDADPLFVDPGNGDFHLAPGSPCIDAGTNEALDLPDCDFEGDSRIFDADHDGTPVADMGVDEWVEAPPPLIYVDLEATGDNDGSSWVDALTNLNAALIWAQPGVEVWVAAGTYTPTWQFDGSDPRSATFQMVNGVAIYGGFDPSMGATEWEDRDWVLHESILSGDIGLGGDASDNSYHVFYHPDDMNLDSSAILDGFTITGGNANSIESQGGGMYNWSSSPMLANLTFSGNSARYGGGMRNILSSPTLVNCLFSGNSAEEGGGMNNYVSSSPSLTNCTFWGNSASYGGGLYNKYDSSPTLTNCIFWADSPPEIYSPGTDSTPVVTFSDIRGGYAGEGNIDADPLFVDADNGDLHLRPGSPCIDAGTNEAPNLPAYDFEGDPRIRDGDLDGAATVDMGVDEFRTHYVDVDAQGANDGSTWENAFTNLQPALDAASAPHQIWVAAGTYKPTAEHGGTGDRYRSFQMVNGVAIYGGFDPSLGDIAFEDRDWESNLTILSGDLNGDDGPYFANNDENSYHVFYHWDITALDSTALLDGFTVTGGNANHPTESPHQSGGGMTNVPSSPAMINCTFSNNSAVNEGGAIYNWNSSPVLTNCAFSGNSSLSGGGMRNTLSSPKLVNCLFSRNSAEYGGGMNNLTASSPVLTNCRFDSNLAGTHGGGMYNAGASPTLTDCTFTGNSAVAEGGGMYNLGSSPTLTNCAFAGNTASSFGGGMHNFDGSSPSLTNCTFTSNSAFQGGGMINYISSSPSLTN